MSQNIITSFETSRSLHQKKALLDYKYSQLFQAVSKKTILQLFPSGKEDIYIHKPFSLLAQLNEIREISEKEQLVKELIALLPPSLDAQLYEAELVADSTRYSEYTAEEKKKTPEAQQQFRYLIKQIAPLIKESLTESDFTTPSTQITTTPSSQTPAHGSEAIKEALQSYLLRTTYYHRIQSLFRETDYVVTLPDKLIIEDTLENLSQGKFVLFLGDTGSGKSELARVIARLLIKKNYANQRKDLQRLPEPIIIGGAKDTALEDLTMEKIITSRNSVGGGGKEEFISQSADITNQLLQQIFNKEDIVNQMLQKVSGKEKKEKIKAELEKMDFYGMHLFTEYHAKGLFKAMKEGLPLIIDEVNAIRPDVLIGINDYITKKIGQSIALPNGLGEFKIAEGFCILTTGNDPQQNSKKLHYNGGRYALDEALKNRLISYAKSYPYQSEEKFMNDENISLDEYLQNNELYGLLLTLFFKPHTTKPTSTTDSPPQKKQKKADTLPLAANISGFELYKSARSGKSNREKQQLFFQEIKNFALAIANIQKAYQGESVYSKTQSVSKDYSTSINHQVISMRQIRNIISAYQHSSYPLEYHIYKEYLSQITTPDEKFSLLQMFADQHFFSDQVGTNLVESESLLASTLRKIEGKENLLSSKKKQEYSPKEKMIISSQDILPQILGAHDLLPDTLFDAVQEEIAKEEREEES
ncbi:MAG: hypothetical protein LBD75_06170 [Candidatus Peribacteria bacterium]|jgi:MoxR-like ATPase|nr:hypothetical protein [Candidatus Peribacteria bacterium]